MTTEDRAEVERIVTRKALEIVLLLMLTLAGIMTLSCIVSTRITALESQVQELREVKGGGR